MCSKGRTCLQRTSSCACHQLVGADASAALCEGARGHSPAHLRTWTTRGACSLPCLQSALPKSCPHSHCPATVLIIKLCTCETQRLSLPPPRRSILRSSTTVPLVKNLKVFLCVCKVKHNLKCVTSQFGMDDAFNAKPSHLCVTVSKCKVWQEVYLFPALPTLTINFL